MFKSVEYLRTAYVAEDAIGYYKLIDDDFECTVSSSYKKLSISVDRETYSNSACREMLTLKEYQKRNLPIIHNLSLMYLYFNRYHHYALRLQFWLNFDRKWIDELYPELEYGKKYFPCLLRQLKMLQFAGKISSHIRIEEL